MQASPTTRCRTTRSALCAKLPDRNQTSLAQQLAHRTKTAAIPAPVAPRRSLFRASDDALMRCAHCVEQALEIPSNQVKSCLGRSGARQMQPQSIRIGTETGAAVASGPAAVFLRGPTASDLAAMRDQPLHRNNGRRFHLGERFDAADVGEHEWQTEAHPSMSAPAVDSYSRNDCIPASMGTEMDQTNKEHWAATGYVKDVGDQGRDLASNTDIANGTARHSAGWMFMKAHPFIGSVLLILLTLVSSSLALSALVSAMQGFNVLVTS